MRRVIGSLLAASLSLTAVAPAFAWGERGHRLINRVAVGALPADGPAFVQAQIDWIGQRGITPDTWRYASEPFLKIDEDPNHGWFMEQLASPQPSAAAHPSRRTDDVGASGWSFLQTIPRSRYEFVLALYDEHKRLAATDPAKAALTNVRWTGTLPYAATETFERIKSAMRIYRDLKTKQADTRFIEMDIAFYIGWLGHYVADGGMPLHASIHHDGWQGENPKNYTRDPRVHGRFESQFVELVEAKEEDFRDRVAAPKRLDDVFDTMLAYLKRSNARVEAVYQLDLEHAYEDKANAKARELVFACMADASSLLRDLIYTAWLDSAEPMRPRGDGAQAPPVQPIDPKHPRFNPATGSAPADRRAPAAGPAAAQTPSGVPPR
jgi:hypothetical protein